ncbi:MAG TPA: phosphoesterase, partial [Clostridiales bacterium]|nr:phosphoesterase [Clostridiales bacterium]
GFHTYNGMNLYITSGIGCSLLPIRFRSKAEIALIE